MLCYWGDDVRAGFGLVKPDGVKKSQSGVFFCSPGARIKQIAHGKWLVGFVRGEGDVSVLRLPQDGGQCGRLKSLKLKDRIRLMSCGETQAVLLAYGGRTLWMDQFNNCGPIKELSSRDIIQVACGNRHCMALTHDGLLFMWGENSRGQLGLGRRNPNSPQPLKSLYGIPLAQISAGGDHSFALSLSGAVFGWGRNNAGQLGLGDTEDRDVPACVNNLSLKRTVFISCGEEHTATLSKGGTVFTFGSGCYGQLGHNSLTDEHRPRVVAGLWGSKVSKITCGRQHTLALVHSSKTIYSFGRGEQGQLENGQQTNQCVPLPVHLPPEANHDQTVEQIVAGGNHSLVLCSRQETDSVKPEPNLGRGILILEDRLINRWITECDSKQWKTIKKEIKTVFSSAACLNGSFIKKGCDGHYQTSTSFSGLDLESVRAAVERLAEKDKVLLQVENVVKNNLLPSLGFTAFGLETLRVYLILPELLRVLNKSQHETKLSHEWASAILRLNPSLLQVLETYWSELPGDVLKALVELFRKPSADILYQKAFNPQENSLDEDLLKFVKVLQLVYKASCSSRREITPTNFFIYEINSLLELLQAVNMTWGNWFPNPVVLANIQYVKHILNRLKSSPCIFNLEAKCNLLKIRELRSCFRLQLRRTALLEDCFSQLKTADGIALKGCLQVIYSEKCEKTDVNKRDFFHNVFRDLLMPESEMFMYNDTETLIWFPSEPSLPAERYYLFGCLCGLAFYNNSVVNLPFPLALFKKLVNIQPSLEDLTEFSPVLGKSLQSILGYSDEDVHSAEMPFTIIWDNKDIDLDPNEPEKVITSSNKKTFVDAYVDFAMNKSVERVFEEFRRGFYKVCDRDVVELFQPEELRGVMVGTEEYDWETLKKNVTYEGSFHARHSTIISFWEVFEELSFKDKKAFLLFLTGFDRVPVLGMNQVKMRVCPLLNSTQDHLPEALTCHSLLQLPVYQTKQTLRDKLIEALQHKRGFWED
ncbi:E3 ISG15--protein ligase HERC5-like [Salminus brasiliensis]|uniref:E3 ISG15--protein ligase HERC5-like n=1 Tax=Salminus brasiliensis TaxID=930266 RepID=UPI003B8332EC